MTATDTHGNTHKITTSLIMVDPAMADRWLENNPHNRGIVASRVATYRDDMRAGRWTYAADPIRFTADGTLLDGQHRLLALAGCEDLTLPFLVVRGLPAEAQYVMDQGARRSTAQQLTIRGTKNSTLVASAVRVYLTWSKGALFGDRTRGRVSTAQIEEFVAELPDVVEALSALGSCFKGIDVAPSISGGVFLGLYRVDRAAAQEFFRLLGTGGGYEGDPANTLAVHLRRIARERRKVADRDLIAAFVLAWNAWRVGRRLTILKRPVGGRWTAESFPVPR